MADEKKSTDYLEILYAENATMFRFYLTWRQRLIAGFLAVLAAVLLGYRWALAKPLLACALPFVGAGASAVFWALDLRNRQLYRHASLIGSRLESRMGLAEMGFYGGYREAKSWAGHSAILSVLYLGCCLLFLLLGLLTCGGFVR